MKRTRLFLVLLVLSAQFATAQVPPTMTTQEGKQEKTHFEKFSDRLRVSYFGVVTTPTLEDIENGKWEYAAISPEFQSYPRNRDTYSTNVWSQVSFNYNFGAKMNFVVNPRFTTFLVNPPVPESSLFTIEDWVVGFQGVVYSSTDKKFNLWVQPGMRLPTSRFSRDNNGAPWGRLTRQVQFTYSPTYDFNKTWQVGIFGSFRWWIYEERYNPWARLRIATNPFVQYTFSDKGRIVIYYENMIENTKRWESINGKKPVFKDVWQNLTTGVNYDITPKLNIYPYIGVFVNDVALSNDSVWFGSWISYQIK